MALPGLRDIGNANASPVESAIHEGFSKGASMSKTKGFAFVLLLIVLVAPVTQAQTPLATDPYVPLSAGEKASLFGHRMIEFSAFGKTAFTSGLDQARDSPEEWGQGLAGYGHRFAHKYANRGLENAFGLLVAVPLHQDPRYFRSGESGAWQRTLHAARSSFITRTDSGGETIAAWRLAGNYGAQVVSNLWRPERQRTVSDTLKRGTVSVGYDVISNLVKEFWPDIRKVLHRGKRDDTDAAQQ